MKFVWGCLSIISGILSVEFFITGWEKLNFTASTYSSKGKFVGGDAYNFMINASQSTSYFIIGGLCVISLFGFLILAYLQHLADLTNKKSS